MELTAEAYKLYTWLFSSIWMRKPVIILAHDLSEAYEHIGKLFPIIPRYRRFYISGQIPQRFPVWLKNPNLLKSNDTNILEKSLLASFDEEKHAHGFTLQLINFDTKEAFFKDILLKIDRGWIAFSTIQEEQLKEIFNDSAFEKRQFGKCTFIFLNGRPRRLNIESRLMRRYMSRNKFPTQNLIQRKMEEIRYTAEFLVSEIENGHFLHQAEIQELFDFDNAYFEKCLGIIQSEFHIDVKRYISRTSTKLKRLQNQIMKLDGVQYFAIVRDNQIVGLKKAATSGAVPVGTIKDFNLFVKKFLKEFSMGTPDQIIIDFKRNTKFILATNTFTTAKDDSIFCFFLDKQTPVASFLLEAKEIISEEW